MQDSDPLHALLSPCLLWLSVRLLRGGMPPKKLLGDPSDGPARARLV
jgi:hypothetical protein